MYLKWDITDNNSLFNLLWALSHVSFISERMPRSAYQFFFVHVVPGGFAAVMTKPVSICNNINK